MIPTILNAYGIDAATCEIVPLTSGLINNTWKVSGPDRQYILQRINDNVFKNPVGVAENIRMIGAYLRQHSPHYLFVSPLPDSAGHDIWFEEGKGYYRVFPYIEGSHTINVASTPRQAFEASLQFGKFTRLLAGFDASRLHKTIPDFHNLTLRFQQYQSSLKQGNPRRISEAKDLISGLKKFDHIVETFGNIRRNNAVKLRVTHHDTKISNVLFDDKGKGLCVIDLDTVMPGFFISDVGDMMRTYLSPANEEEKDFTKIEVREEFFRSIVNGYLSSMGDELSAAEQELILYSGYFLIYMQCIRFLADHFNNDAYYGARYEGQNFVRAGNQLVLLQRLDEKNNLLQRIISAELHTKTHFIF